MSAKEENGSGLLPYIGSLLLGYIIGSIPTAYLLVKWKLRVDIRTAGTGNVGAMNTFDISGSKGLGIVVFFIDMLKGVAAIVAGRMFLGETFWISGVSGIGAIIGHNYPLWLRFKGGRGLSPAVGIMLCLWWIVIPIWCILWAIHFVFSKSVHYANITASFLTPILLLIAPTEWLASTVPASTEVRDVALFACAVFILILLRHSEFIRRQLKAFRN